MKHDDIRYYFQLNDTSDSYRTGLPKGIQPAKSRKKAQIIFGLDESLDVKAEGYMLVVSEDEINITGKDEAGLLYGFMTLKQLMEDAKDQDVNLPVCTIEDFPLLSYRAIHIDVKHHLEKTEYYYQLMDRLAGYKINAIILETEDKIRYKRQPEVGSSDALSIEEWRRLSDYARGRNIEISPLVQGLGHASFILKHEKYRNLRDDPGSDWAFNPLDPKTYEVQFDLYLDAIAATPHGRYLHVGGDEVHTTGRGSGKTPFELNMIWLNKVCRFAEKQGRIPIFWDDMPLKHAGLYRPMFQPELTREEVDEVWGKNEPNLAMFIDQFPKNCIYMRWNYSSPQAIGNIRAMEWYRNNGLQVMGATAGQRRWSLMPLEGSNIENIRSFALSSLEIGSTGLLLTLWDDDSPHFELYMRGISAFAEYTWSGKKRTVGELKTAYRHRFFGPRLADEKFAFIDKLEQPVSYWRNVLLNTEADRYYLRSMDRPLTDGIMDLPDPANKGEWSSKYADRLARAKQLLATSDSLSYQIDKMKQMAVRNHYNLEVYEQVNELVKFSFGALLALKDFDTPSEAITIETASENLKLLSERFETVRNQLEEVYSKTRILTKPSDYILDQDHHHHSANQSLSFDWQFISELLFLEKIEQQLYPELN